MTQVTPTFLRRVSIALLVLRASILLGQTPGQLAIPQTGTVPYGSYAVSNIETIDTVSGNVQIKIPLTSMAPGRAGFGIPLSLIYNSSIYTWYDSTLPTLVGSDLFDPTNSGGWRYSYNYTFTYDVIGPTSWACNAPPTFLYRYRLITPDGSSHTLYINGQTDNAAFAGYYAYGLNGACQQQYPSGTINLYTADGTYIRMVWQATGTPATGPWTAYFPDGRTASGNGFTSANTILDKNGNRITITGTTNGSAVLTTLADDLGRTITITQTPSLPDLITQTGYNNQLLTWTVAYQGITLDSSHTYYCPDTQGLCGPPGPGIMVSSVTLPDLLQYQFQYGTADPPSTQWGQLSQMSLPSGATVQYVYSTTPNAQGANGTAPSILPVASKKLTWVDEDDSSCPGACPSRVETSTYAFSNTTSTFTNPDGGATVNSFFDTTAPQGETPFSGLVYKVAQPNGDSVNRLWAANVPFGSGTNSFAAIPWAPVHLPGNPYIQEEIASFSDGTTLSAKQYQYDRNGNQTQVQEFDCLASSCSLSANGISGGTSLRTTTNTFANPIVPGAGFAIIPSNALSPSPSTSGSVTADPAGYWNTLSPQLLALVATSNVTGSVNGSQTKLTYDCGTGLTHGNLTQEQDWDSGNSVWINVAHTYDSTSPSACVNTGFGNLTSTTNGRNFATQYYYDASSLYIQQRVQAVGTTDARTFTFTHDSYTGALTSQTDVDHEITSTYGYDQYERLKYVNEGNVRSKSIAYNDQARQITERTDGNCFGDHADPGDPNDPNRGNCLGIPNLPLVKYTWVDQLGRVRKTQDWANSLVQTRYLTPAGTGFSYQLQSNPYLTQSESSMGWTLATRDNVGRVTAVQNLAGSALPSPWVGNNMSTTGVATNTYSDNCTISSDEAGVSRQSCMDGLGRLTKLKENSTNATWTYGYDALDNLTSVTPPAGTGRTFTYTSLKQLKSATNPESGTVSYGYDVDGNILNRTDARSKTTTYNYNGLDQSLGSTYNDSTPPVSNTYNKGWLTLEQAGSNSYTTTTWDGIGRVANASQFTNSLSYPFQVQYKPYIGVQAITYPNSTRTVTTTYDSGGRPYSVAGQISGQAATNYVTATTYQPHGAISQQTLASGSFSMTQCNGSTCDNSRLQPTYLQVGSALALTYTYNPTQNNGNLLSQTITRGSQTWTQSYGYSESTGWSINRIACANEVLSATALPCNNAGSAWTQTYGYDLPGNRWLINAGPSNVTADLIMGPATGSGPYDAANRVSSWDALTCWNSANCYDASGNLIAVPATGGVALRTAIYDAENRMASATTSSGVTTSYAYDGSGRRVQKTVGSAMTVYVYDPLGSLAQEYGTGTASATTMYIHADRLGSTRLETDSSGTPVRCYDYLPFGEEIATGTAGRTSPCFGNNSYPTSTVDMVDQKFTSKERDSETGLDYFGARYFSSAQGRFTSPDRVNVTEDRLVSPSNTLNKYVYGGNNPLKFIDPDGEDITLFYTNGGPGGHAMLLAYDQSNENSAVQSFGPANHSNWTELAMAVGIPVAGTANYGFADIKSADQLRQEYSSVTIQTSPEETEKAIQYIKNHSDGRYDTYTNNCTTTCARILRLLNLHAWGEFVPRALFDNVVDQYSTTAPRTQMPWVEQHGRDYGNPRPGYDAFQLLFLSIQNQQQSASQPKESVTSKICFTGDDGKQQCSSSN